MAINNGFDTRYHDINNTDTRKRKGAFFTPKVWVERSQEYIKACLGDDWQDNYYIWDCASGTGNLLTGLTNKYNIYASTLDKQDVDVIKERIDNDIQALPSHVFQFDFLNDDFSKLPQSLQDIISDPIKRKKLVIYINPPYAEVGSGVNRKGKVGVSDTKIKVKYKDDMGRATNELYTQFLMRIHNEIKGGIIAEFSKLKALQGPNFSVYRQHFKADLMRMFIIPGDTFDNVKGQFSIGFKIWNTDSNNVFKSAITDVYDKNNKNIGTKELISYDGMRLINEYIKEIKDINNERIAYLGISASDIQHSRLVFISSKNIDDRKKYITPNNLRYACIYYAVRKCIKATWMNDRDQFLYPHDSYKSDIMFHNDCLAYTLFTNNIQYKYCKDGNNYFIPFTEEDVNAKERYKTSFMTDYMNGKYTYKIDDLFNNGAYKNDRLVFSKEAQDVFDSAKRLYIYYHKQENSNPNAALYDIKEYFQGRSNKGIMNAKSTDVYYTECLNAMNRALDVLRESIAEKTYKYGFLI